MNSGGLSLLKQSDRFRWIILKLVGHVVRVRCVDHKTFEGLLHDAAASSGGVSVELRHVRQVGASVLIKHQEALALSSQEIESIDAVNVHWLMDKSVRHSRRGFNTDTGISRAPGFEQPRELVAWTDDSGALDVNLEDLGFEQGSSWDQFATAKEQWGFQSTYDENLYTTRLDKGSSTYKQKAAEAERIAHEIMNAQTANPHVAEERGQESEVLKRMDDADRYSDVIRDEAEFASSPSPQTTPSASAVPRKPQETLSEASARVASEAEEARKAKLRADAAEFNPFEQMSFLTSAVKPTTSYPTTPPSSPLMAPPYHGSPSGYPHPQMSSPMYYQPTYYGSPAAYLPPHPYPTSPPSY